MKFILSLATTLLLTLSAQATISQPIEITLTPGAVQVQKDQTYSYSFGATPVTMPRYADFKLNNHGPEDLIIDRIGISGIDFDAYFNCPKTLPAGSFCTIRVRFAPWNEGFKTGRLSILTSDGLILVRLDGWATNRF